jgi:omega-6 fatty acid desaturase (delta-12 desaturase)
MVFYHGPDSVLTVMILRVRAKIQSEEKMEGSNADRAKNDVESVSSGRSWPDWYQELAAFRNSNSVNATWQLINTLVPCFLLWYLMNRLIQLGYPYTLTLFLALPAGAFLVRIFILFHDCVHGSFFGRQGVNTFFGYILGVLVFTFFSPTGFQPAR